MSLKKSDLAAAARLILCGERYVIAVHARPDADTIGSALALARGLRQLMKNVTVISQDGVPDSCTYLPDADTVVTETSERNFDVGIICDADGPDRIGTAADAVKSAEKLVIIDHHVSSLSSEVDVAVKLVDVSAAATAELVFELLHAMRVFIDKEVADQLMAGIVGDTGGFRFVNVTPDTLEIASRLAALGASPSTAAREIYENRPLPNAKLLGAALLSIDVLEEGKIVVSRITREDFVRHGAVDADTDSIVNQVRATKGCEVALLFREVEPNMVRVSLRSRGIVDVNRVASAFGGGGHAAASGCTLEMSLEDAEAAVLAEVRRCMAS